MEAKNERVLTVSFDEQDILDAATEGRTVTIDVSSAGEYDIIQFELSDHLERITPHPSKVRLE